MKKKYAMKWIKALRSGKYKQGEETLMRDNKGGYCCLGVLREVCDLGGDHQETLTPFEAKKVGMESTTGELSIDISLADLNDLGLSQTNIESIKNKRFTFDEIADIIEVEWPDL